MYFIKKYVAKKIYVKYKKRKTYTKMQRVNLLQVAFPYLKILLKVDTFQFEIIVKIHKKKIRKFFGIPSLHWLNFSENWIKINNNHIAYFVLFRYEYSTTVLLSNKSLQLSKLKQCLDLKIIIQISEPREIFIYLLNHHLQKKNTEIFIYKITIGITIDGLVAPRSVYIVKQYSETCFLKTCRELTCLIATARLTPKMTYHM